MATNSFRFSPVRQSSSLRLPTWLSGVIGVLFLGLAQPSEVVALPLLVIDQRNDDFPVTGGVGFGAAPLGQEFTPSFTALDIVEIIIGPRDSATVAVVNIRKDSITGPLVGTSLPGTFEESAIHFDFAALVALVPGDRYVIEPVLISGHFGPALSADRYPGGRAIVFGSPLPGGDMGFREGLSVPEPASLSLLSVGLVFVAGRMVRRRAPAGHRLAPHSQLRSAPASAPANVASSDGSLKGKPGNIASGSPPGCARARARRIP